jgi:hypothetical protein
VQVVVRDISTQGCQLEHAEDVGIGKRCELYFDWQGTYVGVEAQAVWKDAQGRAGLKFLRVDKDSQRRLKELCTALGTQPPLAAQRKEADAVRSVPDLAEERRAAPSTTPPGAAPRRPPGPASQPKHRSLPRYVSDLRGHLLNPATGATASVTLVDLSVSGARLEGSELPDAGQTCELQTEWEGKRLVIRGEVVWKGKGQMGLKFSSLDEETEKLVRRICANSWLVPPATVPR